MQTSLVCCKLTVQVLIVANMCQSKNYCLPSKLSLMCSRCNYFQHSGVLMCPNGPSLRKGDTVLIVLYTSSIIVANLRLSKQYNTPPMYHQKLSLMCSRCNYFQHNGVLMCPNGAIT